LGGGQGAALPGPPPNSNPIGRVYFLEALGAAAGVGLVQLFLIGRVPNLVIALGLGLILAAGAAKTRFSLIRGSLVKLLILVLAIGLALAFRLDRESRGWQWPGRRVLAAVDSPYALLTATREAEQFSFFINNLWYFTYPDPYTAEHQVQLALLEHPDPQQVLLLGGGAAGLIPEILKTGAVRRVDYVELDPQLVRLTETLLPAGALAPDARTRIIYQDARTFLNKGAESYDVIILALPEPRNAQLNRFYSLEFFRLVRKRLTPSGVFSFGLTGAPASLSPLRAGYLGAAYNTLKSAFPEVLAFPGEQVRFFASPTEAALTGDPGVLLARLKERGLALKYIRDYYLTYDLSYSRQRYLREVLNGQPPVVNTDLSPRGYFYDLTLASAQEGVPLKEILLFLSGTPSWILWAGLGLWTVLLKLLSRGHSRPLLLYQVVVMGLGTMALEILILILYQIHLGALYQHLGVLMAAFMAGLAAGAILAPRLPQRAGAGAGWLAFFQGGAALLALGLALILPKLTGPFPPVWEGVLQTGLAAALALAGLAGGAIFSLAAAALEQARPSSPGKRAGWLYAVDLLGATLGILGVSFLILPVWGIIPSLYLLAALHAGAAVMVIGEKG
jgi:spermidine synthase